MPLTVFCMQQKTSLTSFGVGTQWDFIKFTLLGKGILNSWSSIYAATGTHCNVYMHQLRYATVNNCHLFY